MKYLKYIIILLISSCIEITDKKIIDNYDITIDGILSQNGIEFLPKDKNGYHHLKLISSNQQPHRITGKILKNGTEPNYSELLEWESNLYWWIYDGDTVATITKTYINYFTGQFTTVQLPPLISSKDEIVPTINKLSYSGKNGEFNTIIAPIRRMAGDTMVVKLEHTKSKTFKFLNIVLE